MDIKTSMALRNYGINPATQSQSQKVEKQAFAGFDPEKNGIDFSLKNTKGIEGIKPDFSSMMKNIAQEAVTTIQGAEKTAIDGLDNKVDAQTVVEAMANAEMTVRTATAVRDKVLEAYQEILRMPI
ncbi:MAG: flagellar hook-basal body complex protein FliE [Alphaproteobacteria bacterium]|jgi:flagellar hook-basal body complex protein FliE